MERDDCLAIHEMMLAQHGGLAGVRDQSVLLSALARPQQRFAYRQASIPALAAGYAFGIVRNHPFVDGNKRTGFMVAVTFLAVNGWTFEASEESVVERTVALASGAINEQDYASWLDENCSR